MRRLFSLFLVIALLAGCSKSEPDNPIPEKPKQESVTLSSGTNAAPVIATAGGSTNVSFTASSSWSASIINTKADSWCSVSPTSGGAGAATITITVKENTTPDNRSASVVIKAGTATQTIKVEQKQQDALTVTASSFEVPAEGGEIKVTAKSNVSFTHTISTDAQSWIKAVQTKALKDSTLTFEIAANDNLANRSGQIFLASGNLKDTVNVYQAGETPTIVVSKDEYVLKSEGESFEVEVASNVNATMSLIFPQGVGAWIGENTTRAISTNKFYLTAQANETYDSRTALLVFSNAENNLADTVTVTQAQKDAIVVAKSSYNVDNSGGTIEIEVGHNIDYECSISADWITRAETKAMETDKLHFNVAENTGYDNREGVITFTAGGGTIKQDVKVYQSEKGALIISKKDHVINDAGGELTLEIKANVEFSVTEPTVDWLHNITTKGLQTHTLKYVVDANETYDSRTTQLYVKNLKTGTQDTLTVTQAQKDAIVVAKSSYNVDNSGGTIEIEVGHNIDYECSISADWITRAETKAMETDKLHFNVAENAGYDNREGVITFTAGGGTIKQDVKVYQSEKGALIISMKDHVTNDAGGELTLEIKANVEFSVTEPTVDWLHNITTKGLQTHTLKYVVDANETYDSRTTQLYVKNLKTGTQDTLTVTQMQKDAIVLAKSEYEFDAEGGSLDFEIQTNVDVTVSIPDSCSSWIRQVVTRGLEAKKLFFDVLPADSVSREGKIILTGGGVTQAVKVLQICTVKLDPAAIPDNEIWYTTIDKSIVSLTSVIPSFPNSSFDVSVLSNEYSNGIGKIKFSSPITEIGSHSFAAKDNLKSIILPGSIRNIGINAFVNCRNLEEVYLKSDDLTIEEMLGAANPLSDCPKLFRIEGPLSSEDKRCLIIDNCLYSFAPADVLEYTIPQGVKVVKDGAFRVCKLNVITVPEGVEKIEAHAFQADSYTDTKIKSSLEYVHLPTSLKELHPYAFLYNNSIKFFYGDNKFITDDNLSLVIDNYGPNNHKALVVFASGANITEYSIPEGIESVESYAFYYATSLKKLNFPSSITTIYSAHAFEGTVNIETITGNNVAEDNRSLIIDSTLIMLAGGNLYEYTTPKGVKRLGYQVLGFKDDIVKYVISDEVTEIDGMGYIFNQCPNLETVTLSARLTYLGYDPFSNEFWATPKLKNVYCRAPIPPSVSYNLMGDSRYQFDDLKIYVPQESLEAYQYSHKWSYYKDYLRSYDYGDLSEFYPETHVSTDYSQDGKVITLQTATKGKGIDIVLMGDAYSDRQIADGTYRTDMENLYNNLFIEEPYKSFKDHFNVFYVNVVSATEGYEYGNTALDGFFGGGTLVGGNDNAVVQYALKAISEEKMDEALLVVAMNSDNYAGTCYMYNPEGGSDYGSGVSVSYFPKGGDAGTFAQLIHHEACGHGFAKLADEYAYEDMGAVSSDYVAQTKSQQNNWGWWKNVDFTNDPAQVRWAKFLEDSRYANDGLGVFEGGLTYWNGVWRPTENSIMRYNTGGFNAPSREAIYYRIHKLAYGTEWVYDYEKFVEYDALSRDASTAASTKSPSVVHYKPLHPPVVHNKSWRDAKKEN